MIAIVLDASAVLAALYDEPGADVVRASLDGALIAAVNYAEVVGKLIDDGFSREHARETVRAFGGRIVAIDEELAFESGALRHETRSLGLSLGDRACLALAQQANVIAYTADKRWGKLKIGVEIRVIR